MLLKRSGPTGTVGGRRHVVVVAEIHLPAKLELLEVVPAGEVQGFGFAQRRQKHARQNRNVGNDDEKFDEGEGATCHSHSAW